MIHNKFRYLLTLVALFAISTGAWADYTVTWEGATLKSVNVASYGENNKTQTIGDITVTANLGYFKDFGDNGVIASAYEANGLVFSANAKFISVEVTASSSSTFNHTSGSATSHTYTVNPTATSFALPYGDGWIDITKIVFTFENAPEPPIEVTPVAEPAANTKQWTFAMPGSDVVLTPQYAPAAQLDENGAPAAVSGLEIAADAAIITAGQSAQGTLLYAVGTSATEKPALTAFAATLPNAKDQTAAGNYYVWYYIQGQDTPQGQEPTAENTFNDSEIMGPVMVELLTNEHTLNIKQSPNITVTVAGTAVTPTDDKVTPVTTGQEVKIKAKDGYKFRKVEVKKGGGEPVLLTTILSTDNASFTSGSKTFDNIATVTFSGEVANDNWGWYQLNGTTLTVTPVEGITITRVKFTCEEGSAFDETAPFEAVLGDPWYNPYMLVNGTSYGQYGVTKIEVYGTK